MQPPMQRTRTVSPASRRPSLFRYLARIAVERQYVVVQWDVNLTNTRAIEFYRRLGAQLVSNDLMMQELRPDALLALARQSP